MLIEIISHLLSLTALYFVRESYLCFPDDYLLSKLNAMEFCNKKYTKLPIVIFLGLVSWL